MPKKRRLVTSKVCFGSKRAGLLENSYDKCALKEKRNQFFEDLTNLFINKQTKANSQHCRKQQLNHKTVKIWFSFSDKQT